MKRIVTRQPAGSPEVGEGNRREARLNLTISRVLLIGLLVAIALLVLGAILTLARPGLSVPRATSIADMPRAVAALEPSGLFDLGLLALLVTPVAGVITIGIGFARRGSWWFCGLSIFILAILALSAFLGLRG
jgi:uncharacterized membrane protein